MDHEWYRLGHFSPMVKWAIETTPQKRSELVLDTFKKQPVMSVEQSDSDDIILKRLV